MLGPIKSNWRVFLLVVFVSVALVALFIPGGIMGDDTIAGQDGTVDDNPTNIQYGLGLDGGTRISAPVVGMTAEGIEIDPDEQTQLESDLYDELGVDTGDLIVRFDEENNYFTAEVFTRDVDEAEFRAALEAAGVDVERVEIRDGVTQQTRDEIIRTIQTKINEAGLDGGTAYQQAQPDGYYIVTEVPDMSPQDLRALLEERGIVEVVAHYPDGEGGQQNETLLVQEDFGTIGSASFDEQNQQHYVPVTITSEKAPEYEQQLEDKGFLTNTQQCGYDEEGSEGSNYCLLTVVDGEVVDAHSMGPDLADSMLAGQWQQDPSFRMITPTGEDARSLAVNLQAGELRAPLDFDNHQEFSLDPALADQFKLYSLFIGVLSVLTVSGMVYIRYKDPRVALPMIVTALSEVVILLGFAALIRMPLDLSHVAGFIAVVGTGVDDLIIIADEVMSEGDVNSQRVFDSRFRKAFWIIGAAAATTIIAMSPLAVLSLGDLLGFAIITILGVLIGVFITRPAYGDILRYLLTDDK